MTVEVGRARDLPAQLAAARELAPNLELAHLKSSVRSALFGIAGAPTVVGGHTIHRLIGRGGMGAVYEASDERGEVVALKTLHGFDPAALFRLKQEFRALADLDHPNLVGLHHLVAVGDQVFVTMESIDGRDFLAAALAGTPLSVLLPQLVAGVAALHAAGKLHRDLKPSNVLVTRAGRVVILDFGLVQEWGGPLGELVGTPAYMAPELLLGAAPTPASDWYSVGVMLHEALAGRLPFPGDSAEALRAKLSTDPPAPLGDPVMVDLCRRLLTRDPELRAGSREILHALGEESAPPAARRPRVTLVGRTAELAALHAARTAALAGDGAPAVVLVRGGSGVGKTTLVQAFLDGLARNTVILAGRCYAREQVPHNAFDSLIDALTGHLLGRSIDDQTAALVGDVAALAHLFPVLRRLPAVAAAHTAAVRSGVADAPTGPVLRDRAYATLHDILAWLGARAPVVLHLDDLQWADADSVALLAGLTADPPRGCLLIVGLGDDDDEPNPSVRALVAGLLAAGTLELRLTPLAVNDALTLARDLLAASPPLAADPAALAASASAVARESAGLPLFVHELAHHRREHDLSPGTDSSAPRLADLVAARTARLPPAARELLEILAVEGRPLPTASAIRIAGKLAPAGSLALLAGALAPPAGSLAPFPGTIAPPAGSLALLAGILGAPSTLPTHFPPLPGAHAADGSLTPLTPFAPFTPPAATNFPPLPGAHAPDGSLAPLPGPAALRMLRATRLIRTRRTDRGELVELAHDRIREVVLAGLDARRKRECHLALADELRLTASPEPEALATHLREAGQTDRARAAMVTAARQASHSLAFNRAAELLLRAIDLSPVTDAAGICALRVEAATALASAGRSQEAADCFLNAAATAPPQQALDLRRRAAETLLGAGAVEPGRAHLDEVLAALGVRLPRGRAARTALLAAEHLRLRLRGLEFTPRRAADIGESTLARLDSFRLARVALAQHDPIGGEIFLVEQLRRSLDVGEPGRIVRSLASHAVYLAQVGERNADEATRTLTLARDVAARHRLVDAGPIVSLCSGMVAFNRGAWQAALTDLDAAGLPPAHATTPAVEAVTRAMLVGACGVWALASLFHLGDLVELQARRKGFLELLRNLGDHTSEARLLLGWQVFAALAADDPRTALQELSDATRGWRPEAFPNERAHGTLAAWAALTYSGDGPAAWGRVATDWPAFTRSYVYASQHGRVSGEFWRGAAALLAARSTPDPRQQLAAVESACRTIADEQVRWAAPLGHVLRAGLAVRCHPGLAAGALAVAIAGFDAAGMHLWAAAARWQAARLAGDEARRESALARMTALGAANPQRMAACLVPVL